MNTASRKWAGQAPAQVLQAVRVQAPVLQAVRVQDAAADKFKPTLRNIIMKAPKALPLILLAASLASGTVYAKGGGGMGGGNAWGADHGQRTEQRSRIRTQKRDGLQDGDAQRHEYRHENREPMHNANTLPSMQ